MQLARYAILTCENIPAAAVLHTAPGSFEQRPVHVETTAMAPAIRPSGFVTNVWERWCRWRWWGWWRWRRFYIPVFFRLALRELAWSAGSTGMGFHFRYS